MRAYLAAALIAISLPAAAGSNIRILPDQAVLACQARATHALAERGDAGAEPVERFTTEAMPDYMFRVKGVYSTRIDGGERRVEVECDVSSTGVEVFTMVVNPAN